MFACVHFWQLAHLLPEAVDDQLSYAFANPKPATGDAITTVTSVPMSASACDRIHPPVVGLGVAAMSQLTPQLLAVVSRLIPFLVPTDASCGTPHKKGGVADTEAGTKGAADDHAVGSVGIVDASTAQAALLSVDAIGRALAASGWAMHAMRPPPFP